MVPRISQLCGGEGGEGGEGGGGAEMGWNRMGWARQKNKRGSCKEVTSLRDAESAEAIRLFFAHFIARSLARSPAAWVGVLSGVVEWLTAENEWPFLLPGRAISVTAAVAVASSRVWMRVNKAPKVEQKAADEAVSSV